MEYIGYPWALLAIGCSVTGFISIFGLRSHLKKWLRIKPEKYPTLTIIAPQCGKINPKNINALLTQNYPGVWEVIFYDDKRRYFITAIENILLNINMSKRSLPMMLLKWQKDRESTDARKQ